MTHTRKFILTIGIVFLFVIGITTSLYLYITGFDLQNFFISLDVNIYEKIGIIIGLYMVRNYLFIPSTIIIILSGFVLQDFFLTTIVSIIGVSIGIAETYAIGYLFREDIMGESKELHLINKYKKQIQENGVKVIFFSCMFPLTPVDLVYYAAGFVKYRFLPFFMAAIMGEMWLILLYAYLGIEAQKYTTFFVYFALFFAVLFGVWWLWKQRKK